mgnify:CR=1 FL=1
MCTAIKNQDNSLLMYHKGFLSGLYKDITLIYNIQKTSIKLHINLTVWLIEVFLLFIASLIGFNTHIQSN